MNNQNQIQKILYYPLKKYLKHKVLTMAQQEKGNYKVGEKTMYMKLFHVEINSAYQLDGYIQ